MGPLFSRRRAPLVPNVNIKKPPRILSCNDFDFTHVVLSNKEDVTLIWFDENIKRRDDTAQTKIMFQAANYYVLLCDEIETCMDCIKAIKQEKIVLVLSGAHAHEILREVHAYKNLDSVFIFCMKNERYRSLYDDFSKLKNIHTTHEGLFEDLTRNIHQLRRQLIAFTLFSPKSHFRHLTFDSAEFMWFLLLKEVLTGLPMTSSSKEDMINQCRDYYRHDSSNLEMVDKFERTYEPSHAINWYTRPSFVAGLVNKALRTEDIDLLYTFRFFIVDLSESIRSLSVAQSTGETYHLYRGLTLSSDEIDKFLSNIGNLLSPNGFMSTSRSADVAVIYGENAMFKIEVDTSLKICADIKEQSNIGDEEEVLFDLGSTFRIEDVSYNNETSRWIIKLVAVPDGVELKRELYDYHKIIHTDIFFGELIYLMGQYERAKRYFRNILQRLKKEHSLTDQRFMALKVKCEQQAGAVPDGPLKDSVRTLLLIAEAYQLTSDSVRAMEHLNTVWDNLSTRTIASSIISSQSGMDALKLGSDNSISTQ